MLYVSRHQRLSSSRTPHLRVSLLEALLHFRAETAAEFSIVADCWPGGATAVCRTLGLSPQQCRQLRPLSTKNLVAILKAAGVSGPECYYIIWYVNLSAVPGLAAMLAHICKTGYDLREVCHGRVLADWVDSTFRDLLANVQCSSSRPSRSAVTQECRSILSHPSLDMPPAIFIGHDSTSAGGNRL